MNITKNVATLREVAARLESVAAAAPRSAKEVIARSGIKILHTRNYVDLFFLGSKDYDARRHLCVQAAHQQAEHIADKLEFEMKTDGSGMRGSYDPHGPHYPNQEYTASLYVLAPAELEKLLQDAYCAGRCA